MFRKTEELIECLTKKFKHMTYNEFFENFRFGTKSIGIDEYTKNKENPNAYKNRLYELYQTNFLDFVLKYFKTRTSVSQKDYIFAPQQFEYETIDGVKTVNGRIGRRTVAHNIFFEHMYTTHKIHDDATLLNALQNACECRFNRLASESVIASDEMLVMSLNTSFQKMSVFNPMCWSMFIDAIRQKTDKLESILTPVGSWGSPAIAFANSNLKEMVMIDVIPEVLEKSENIFNFIDKRGLRMFEESNKTFKTFCCPSQHIDKRLNFCDTYKNHFDAVFFSPAYYDLEQYEGGEQSWKEYFDYQSWLNGYWEGTVKTCYDSIRTGGVFAFVIIPQYNRKGKKIEISSDMLEIAKRYFDFDETMHLSWGNTNRGKFGAAEMIEHVHFLIKR